jgi:hypothetical protein
MVTLLKVLGTLVCFLFGLGCGIGSIDLLMSCWRMGFRAGPLWPLFGMVVSMSLVTLAIIPFIWSKKARSIFD